MEQNLPHFDVGEAPIDVAGLNSDNIAYAANYDSNTVSVIDGDALKVSSISVGKSPWSVAIDYGDNIAYVTNSGSNTVSVIDGDALNASISVGKSPQSVDVDSVDSIAYVANAGSNSVSVINGTDGKYRNIANITVGESPEDIAVDDNYNIVYVANSGSNTVSVINGTDGKYRNIANITVGNSPVSVDLYYDDEIAYVANYDSNTVSVLSFTSQQVQSGVSFDVSPSHAGHVDCNDTTIPTNQYFYVDSRTQCTAQANEGFQFNSWIENLGSNSSRTISASQGDWFTKTLDWVSGKPSPATLDVTKFGNFTANFESLPPAIPPEYLATLFTVVVTAFVGSWLTPSFIGWSKTRKQGKRLDCYQERVKHVYKDTLLSDEQKEKELGEIKDEIENAYAKGKLNEQQHKLLNKRIESFVNPNENKISANKLQGVDDTHTTKRSPI